LSWFPFSASLFLFSRRCFFFSRLLAPAKVSVHFAVKGEEEAYNSLVESASR
jgi:hypothetical protein